MPETSKNWLGFVNLSVYYARQTRGTYQVLSYSVDFKSPFEIHWVRQYLVNVVLFRLKDLYKSEMSSNNRKAINNNLFIAPVNISPIFDTDFSKW